MRIRFLCVLLSCILYLGFLSGCDSNKPFMDDVEMTVNTDATRRVLRNVPDTLTIIFDTNSSWKAYVSNDAGDWCVLSQYEGGSGKNSIILAVKVNSTSRQREAQLVIEAGTVKNIYPFYQKAGEPWFDVLYWNRTLLQRMGLRGKVSNIQERDKYTYKFDVRGNMISHSCYDDIHNRVDTVKRYSYDTDNHRLTCDVTRNNHQDTVRSYRYEYNNAGKFVACSASGWMEQDPMSEQMDGWIVPDLSGIFKKWKDGDDVMHEDCTYSFADNRLIIKTFCWKEGDGGAVDSVSLLYDTVAYRLFDDCNLLLPYSSRYVKSSDYFRNGMLKMFDTFNGRFEFLESFKKIVMKSCTYPGKSDPDYADRVVFTYDDDFEMVKRIDYHGENQISVSDYSNYHYDNYHNWCERDNRTYYYGSSQPVLTKTERFITYH